MSTRSSDPLVKSLQRSFAAAQLSSLTDADLMERFRSGNDPAAFDALIRRHGRLVLSACRTVLADEAAVEDAFQATFLVLLQQAGSLRQQSSVRSYLYGVARRVALQAKASAASRQRREQKSRGPATEAPAPDQSWREACDVLHQELERLPAKYRQALWLCYFEGQTSRRGGRGPRLHAGSRERQPGARPGDVAEAICERGITLSAALLLAGLVNSPAGAVSPRLVTAVLSAASGSAPAAVAELARGVAMNGMLKKLVLALAALIAVVALGWGLGSGSPQAAGPLLNQVAARGADNARDEKKPAPEAPKLTTVSGRVLDPDGKPLAGAELQLLGNGAQPKDVGASGADGRFKVEVPAKGKDLYLLARADGVGFDFLHLEGADLSREVELLTVKDQTIRGRIVDTQGKPVAGATLTVKHVGIYKDNSLDAFLAEWKTRHFMSGLPGGVKQLWREEGAFPVVTTDADGRFSLAGTGTERLVALRLRGTGIAFDDLWVVNRAGFDPKPYNQAMHDNIPQGFGRGGFNPLLYGPDLNFVAEAEKPIRGVVKDADTGKPRARVRVTMTHQDNEMMLTEVSATTDADGRYEMRGARKAKSYTLNVPKDPVAGLLDREVRVGDTNGYEPITVDFTVAKGVVITGRVIDGATGKPMAGFATAAVLSDNPFVKSRPEFGTADWTPFQNTDADGVFRVVTIPGPVLLMGGTHNGGGFMALIKYKPPVPDPKYPQYFNNEFGSPAFIGPGGGISPVQGNFCKVLDIKPGTEVVNQDVVLELASTLPVKIRDAEGQPVAGAWVAGVGALDFLPAVKTEGDTATIYHLEAGKPRLLAFYDPSKKLFGTLSLKGDEKDEVTVRLAAAAAITGRLLGEDGKPLAGVAVSLHPHGRAAEEVQKHARPAQLIETDADGRFRIDTVIPGVKFFLSFKRGQKTFEPAVKGDEPMAKSGETLDLGEWKLKPKEE